MNVIFYKNNSDKRKARKNLTNIATFTCTLKDNTSVTNPIFQISKNSFTNYSQANYAYVPELKRYFFIVDTTLQMGGILEFKMHTDVLSTSINEVLLLRTFVERQENVYNTYIPDNELPVRMGRILTMDSIGSVPKGNGQNIVVTVNGGTILS